LKRLSSNKHVERHTQPPLPAAIKDPIQPPPPIMATTPSAVSVPNPADESLDYSMTLSGEYSNLHGTPKQPQSASTPKSLMKTPKSTDPLPPSGSASKFLSMAAKEIEAEESTADNNNVLLKAAQNVDSQPGSASGKPTGRRASTARTMLSAAADVEDTNHVSQIKAKQCKAK